MRDASIATTIVSGAVSNRKPSGKRDLARSDVIVNAQRCDVDLQMFRNPVCRTRDLEFVRDDVHDGAGVPNAFGDADGDDREPRIDRFVGRNALEIGVDDPPRDGMTLDLAHEHGLPLPAAVGQRDDGIASRTMDQLFEGMRVDGDVLGDYAVPVEDRRKLPGRAQRVRAGRAELLAVLDRKVELFIRHGFLYRRTARRLQLGRPQPRRPKG